MSRHESFRFKQFGIADSRSGMKLGTDAVLLGAWTCAEGCAHALDVGAGTGILSLMLAQRYPACRISAVEIEPGATADARENFGCSPWADRLSVAECSFEQYRPAQAPDLIVSNPPYFSEGLEAPEPARACARHGRSLTYRTLIEYSAEVLAPEGTMALVAPAELLDNIVYSMEMAHLKVRRLCRVSSVSGRPPVRVLVQASRRDGHLEDTSLAIKDADGSPDADFRRLTSDFYLKF